VPPVGLAALVRRHVQQHFVSGFHSLILPYFRLQSVFFPLTIPAQTMLFDNNDTNIVYFCDIFHFLLNFITIILRQTYKRFILSTFMCRFYTKLVNVLISAIFRADFLRKNYKRFIFNTF
jgi:hypothetical protein